MRLSRTRWIFLAAVTVHLVTAWFSTGFHAADEHYQVIEFAEAKLGHVPINTLPWEYAAQIRSALLPSICWVVFRAAHAVGINDPFMLAFLLRLLTAALALTAVTCFVRAVRGHVPEQLWTPFLLLSYFLWFLPFMHVRFTGETWSGLLFLLGLASLLMPGDSRSRHFRTGLFFGLAIICRPPVLAMCAGVVLWLLFVQREKREKAVLLCVGIFTMALLGLVVDHWFYGDFTLTTWNYLRLGIFGHGDHPFVAFAWWYYPAWVLKYATLPIGAALLAAAAMLFITRPKHILTWSIVPFLILHIIIPHKELRFLYPLADLLPWMLTLALVTWMDARIFRQLPRWAITAATALIVVVNLLALSVVVSSPAGNGSTRLARAVHDLAGNSPVMLTYVVDEAKVWDILIPRFYLPPESRDTLTNDVCAETSGLLGRTFLITSAPLPDQCEMKWTKVEQALPAWKVMALKGYDLEDAKPVWTLYEEVE